MPTIPAVPPHDRFFARLEKFQLSCPSCGRLLTSWQDQGHLAKHFNADNYKEQKYRRRMRTVKSVQYLTWNPFTQRLTCPWCNNAFVVGLIAYPAKKGGVRPAEAPPDTVLSRAQRLERLELRRLAGGWLVETEYEQGQAVNVHVPATCTCPPRGWQEGCPLHGQQPGDPGVGGK